MRVLLVAAEDGCGHYRMRLPAAALAEQETTLTIDVTSEGLAYQANQFGRVTDVLAPPCDVLVLQRPMQAWVPQAIPHYQSKGIRVVVEVDDDFHAIHPRNGAYPTVHPKLNPQSNWHHLMKACGIADLVTVTTPALAERYGAHGRVRVIPNYVSQKLLEIPRAGDGHTIGWAGIVGVHPDDLQATRGGVNDALGATGARFLNVGTGELVQRNLGLHNAPEATGYVPLDAYPHAVARFDVGIVPLADTRFNAAKSWLKGLELAALGVPFVASDVAEYRRLRDDYGIGGVVKPRARDWKRNLVGLLDPDLNHELSLRGRELVADHLTIERNAWRFADAWEEAL